MKRKPFAARVRVLVDRVEPAGVEAAGAADNAVDLVAFAEQELGEIRAVLAGDAGEEGLFQRKQRSGVRGRRSA